MDRLAIALSTGRRPSADIKFTAADRRRAGQHHHVATLLAVLYGIEHHTPWVSNPRWTPHLEATEGVSFGELDARRLTVTADPRTLARYLTALPQVLDQVERLATRAARICGTWRRSLAATLLGHLDYEDPTTLRVRARDLRAEVLHHLVRQLRTPHATPAVDPRRPLWEQAAAFSAEILADQPVDPWDTDEAGVQQMLHRILPPVPCVFPDRPTEPDGPVIRAVSRRRPGSRQHEGPVKSHPEVARHITGPRSTPSRRMTTANCTRRRPRCPIPRQEHRMIPRNRPTMTEADVALRAGVPLATWRRRDAPAFRAAVADLLPGTRWNLYDEAQALAHLAGRPVPVLPAHPDDTRNTPEQRHPEDRLTDTEAAAILGIEAATVRSYATHGYLPRGERIGSARVWPRHAIDERRDNPPGQGTGGGRKPGSTGPRKERPYEGDPRLALAAQALAAAPDKPVSTIAFGLAVQHGGSVRTWERIVAAVGEAP